ncbi:nose resistant to fluoxetine protein 6-like [Centruroides sculpturatus]|uniref:nose resistant to fluoxetine protein 6-like n=1 Tax=Centruroides sculpturatus TaxID=218467 RepID=UPI000C6CDD24|nr:nose resistant to fluoxetine protein 6-like [Centruroides sculpturatus]
MLIININIGDETCLIDSLGKPFGIFSGKFWLHGDYDQCLNIEVIDDETRKNDKKLNTLHGKFCALTIGFNSYEFNDVPVDNNTKNMLRMMKDIVKPFPLSKIIDMVNYSKVLFRVDICVPSTCSREDVENILQWAMKDSYRAAVKFCKMKDDKIRLCTIQIICITAISIFITCVFIGTFLETLIILNIVNVRCDKGKILQSCVSVSLITSNQKLFTTDFNNETRFICGIKFLLTCIVVFAHIFVFSGFVYTTAGK